MNFGESAAPPESSVPAASADLGKLLCATRMRLGKDLQRIADVLHIRYNFLVAIEDGRYEDLPGQAYAIGFVRAYADHLGLDGDEIVRRYKEESAGLKQKSAFEFQMPTSDSALPSGTLLLIAVVAGMVIYGAWYSMAGSDRSAVELIQEVPERLAAIANSDTIQAALPVVAQPSPTDVVDGGDLASEPDETSDETPGGTNGAPPAGETSVAAATPAPAVAPPATSTTPAALTPPATTPVTTPATAPPPIAALPQVTDVLELRAKADVWITLRDAKATERTQFLRKDEVLRLPEQEITTLVTANAGDLEILVNGKTMPPLDAGLFARGVALDPQKLKSAATAASAPTPAKPAAAVPAAPVPAAAAPAATAPAATAPAATAPAGPPTVSAPGAVKPAPSAPAVPAAAAPAPSTPPSN
jgi:cytoskeleton protein RodZ